MVGKRKQSYYAGYVNYVYDYGNSGYLNVLNYFIYLTHIKTQQCFWHCVLLYELTQQLGANAFKNESAYCPMKQLLL